MYRLRDLLDWGTDTEIAPGVWVSARPLDGPFIWRVRAAWAVLRGRADAFTWPAKDDPTGWCSSPHSERWVMPTQPGAAGQE